MPRPRPRRAPAFGATAAVLLGAVLLAGCVPPAGGPPGGPPVLYVANALDGTVTRLDARSGRVLGPPIPAGPAPAHLVAGPGGALLVLAAGTSRAGQALPLTHVSPAGSGWAVRPVPQEPGATGTLLAGDGGARMVVAHHAPAPGAGEDPVVSRLTLLDARSGDVQRTHTLPPALCGPQDSLRSLALADVAGTPLAYLGVWRWPGGAEDAHPAGRGQILAVRAESGAVAGVTSLAGDPQRLVAGGASGEAAGAAPRLLCVEETPGPPSAARAPEHAPPDRRHLLAVDPLAGRVEAVYPLPEPARALALAPGGRDAYLLAALDGPRSVLTHVEPPPEPPGAWPQSRA